MITASLYSNTNRGALAGRAGRSRFQVCETWNVFYSGYIFFRNQVGGQFVDFNFGVIDEKSFGVEIFLVECCMYSCLIFS